MDCYSKAGAPIVKLAPQVLLVLGMLALSRAALCQPRYQVQDMGPVQRLASDLAPGLNAKGDVVLWRQDESLSYAAVLVSGGQPVRLPIPSGFRNSFAYSVNDNRDAVGWANTTLNPVDSFSTVHAVLLNAQGVTDLGTLGGSWSRAYAINNHGVIVGISESQDKGQLAFQYAKGKMTALPPLPGARSSMAFGVNDAGIIVGGADVPHGDQVKMLVHAVVWRDGKPVDLGALTPEGNSLGYAVNSHGEVVGKAGMAENQTAFLYSNGRMVDLGIKEGRAFGINDQTQIVGVQQMGEERHPHTIGFLWEKGSMYDLNQCLPKDSPYHIQGAFRINNAGQIATIGTIGNELHVLLLTPVK